MDQFLNDGINVVTYLVYHVDEGLGVTRLETFGNIGCLYV